ncbi:unnamed protein product [Lactuca virosa]|uniref:Uncharacterized protein n=1 Tax=Lactuca virosa TaxID=75947 RepID=A0AAU9P1C6_9ASTR|nr:unnamed protein product [Lactuca virosa]
MGKGPGLYPDMGKKTEVIHQNFICRLEDDVVSVCDNSQTVHEPKLKVEKHEFCFDVFLDQKVTNDEVNERGILARTQYYYGVLIDYGANKLLIYQLQTVERLY